ncbi:MAG: RluA family pseudouridine synthase [Candidatus Kapaibacteriales bacterium]
MERPSSQKAQPGNNGYSLIHRSETYLVVNKMAGVLSVPGRYDDPDDNLTAFLNSEYGKVYVVHRLDRDTSGIMLYALTPETHREFSMMFEHQNIQKIYDAVLEGEPVQDYDIDIPITSDPSKKGKSMPAGDGKPSLTKMKVEERYGRASLVKCDLVTGRHHQLRVHVSTIGNPLLIDPLYGEREEFFLSEFKRKFNTKKGTEEKALISRITMHAKSLTFNCPDKGEEVSYEADWPKDFRALVNQLRKLKKR